MPLDLDMPLRKQQMRSEEQPLTLFPKKKSRGSSPTEEVYWWRLNNTNCNLHDMSLTCEGKTIDQCKTVCQNDPACGGFLYYTKTGKMALKNSTCWGDLAPLPPSDAGDDIFVMHGAPQPVPDATPAVLDTVEVCVAPDASEHLGPDTNESYTLAVLVDGNASTANVTAANAYGVMHALESLTQLIDVGGEDTGPKTIPNAPVHIVDAPRFSYRGVVIDSGRHFLPVTLIKRVIEAAAMVKLNVIHWHLVDSQSFPSCSALYPQLCQKGAYPNAFSNSDGPTVTGSKAAAYSAQDLAGIVAFAKTRGVRIQPEWDVPGHGSWGFGMPELVASACADVLDVTRPELYLFLKAFLEEMGDIFTDEYMFFGGDKVDTECFTGSPTIAKWMAAHGLNASTTQQYFWRPPCSRT
eukprot:m.721300 g.721300  ORF g.721300 m.721300 type:complete len:409 (+) comp23013_c0_seq8:1774-3000(+)